MTVGATRGAALPLILIMLIAIEGLLLVLAATVLQVSASARLGQAAERARVASEAGAWAFVSASNDSPWRSTQLQETLITRDSYDASTVMGGRVSAIVQSTGQDRDGRSRANVGLLVTSRPQPLNIEAALTHDGAFTGAGIISYEAAPTAAGCSAGTVEELASRADVGSPELELGAQAWDTLALAVVWPVPGTTAEGHCAVGTPSNWGDPLDRAAPCGSHFSTYYRDGDLVVTGGRGQGALVVSGDLHVDGGFAFRGLVVVGQTLTVGPGGAAIEGALVVGGEGPHELRGRLAMTPSRCSAEMGLPGTGRLKPLPRFGWIEIP